jgi:hypothetical protein
MGRRPMMNFAAQVDKLHRFSPRSCQRSFFERNRVPGKSFSHCPAAASSASWAEANWASKSPWLFAEAMSPLAN